jgi:hypothetical protein
MNCNEHNSPLTVKVLRHKGRQSAGDRTRTHGMSGTAIYSIWDSMIQRCYNQNRRDFKSYGANGVTVCEKWRASFIEFFNDMGHRPDGMSLDRINPEKGYSPDNCRWATTRQQARNRRVNRMLTHDGKTMCLQEWAEEVGINNITLQSRLAKNWTVERALTQPVARIYSHQKNRKPSNKGVD